MLTLPVHGKISAIICPKAWSFRWAAGTVVLIMYFFTWSFKFFNNFGPIIPCAYVTSYNINWLILTSSEILAVYNKFCDSMLRRDRLNLHAVFYRRESNLAVVFKGTVSPERLHEHGINGKGSMRTYDTGHLIWFFTVSLICNDPPNFLSNPLWMLSNFLFWGEGK